MVHLERSTLHAISGPLSRCAELVLSSQPAPAPPPEDRLVCYCRTTSASSAPCTSRRVCGPAHCASYCAPCQPLLRAFSGWIRSPPPTATCRVCEYGSGRSQSVRRRENMAPIRQSRPDSGLGLDFSVTLLEGVGGVPSLLGSDGGRPCALYRLLAPPRHNRRSDQTRQRFTRRHCCAKGWMSATIRGHVSSIIRIVI